MNKLLMILLVFLQVNIWAQTRVNTPVVNGKVKDIIRHGSNVFIAGEFNDIGGTAISSLAMLNADDGTLRSWFPNPNNVVNHLTLHNGKLIVSGNFTSIAGQARQHIAIFDAATGVLDPVSPSISFEVHAAYGDSNIIYYATRTSNYYIGLERFNLNTGVVDSWHSDYAIFPGDVVHAIAKLNGYIYVGGDFLAEIPNANIFKRNICRFDVITGELDSVAPINDMQSSNWVEDVVAYNSKLYVGGSISYYGGMARKGFFTLDSGGQLLAYEVNASNSQIYDLFVQGNNIWVGGNSAIYGGQSRLYIGQVDLMTGLATCWQRQQTDSWMFTHSLFVQGDTVYAGAAINGSGSYFHMYVGNPTPYSENIYGPDTVFLGQSSTYYSVSHTGNTYSWTHSGLGQSNNDSISIIWNSVGEQTISLEETGPSNCVGNTASKTVVVLSPSTHIIGVDKTKEVWFNNPCFGTLYLSYYHNTNHILLNLRTMDGRLLIQKTIDASTSIAIDVNELSSGTYLLESISDNSVYTQKLLIQK